MTSEQLLHSIKQGENIEITNPGKLMGGLKVEDLYADNYISRHRNKLTTEAFYLTGDIEKYGNGFKRLREWFSAYPELNFKVVDLHDFIQVKVSSKSNDPVNVRQKQIIRLIGENKYITREILAKECNISVETIKRDIRQLRELNIIKRVGSDKSGHWEIINRE